MAPVEESATPVDESSPADTAGEGADVSVDDAPSVEEPSVEEASPVDGSPAAEEAPAPETAPTVAEPSAADSVASVIAEAPDVEVPADAEAPSTVETAADETEPAVTGDAEVTGEDPDIEVSSSAEAPAAASASVPADDAPADDAAADAAPADEAPADAAPTDEAPPAPAPAATPAPRPSPSPRPAPRPPLPRAPQPTAPAAATESSSTEPWGRVEDDGTVSVREGSEWRVVGQYPDGTPAEALAYFERKFSDLASEVTLLEGRHRAGGASASDLRSTAEALRGRVVGAAAVGDLARLDARLSVLTSELAADSESEAAAAKEAVQEAVRFRTELVEKAEALAARDPKSIQWKQASADLASLFEQWQAHQQDGPRLPRSTGQQLWKRFRDARSIVDKHRREFYAGLDEEHKGVKERKTRLVEKAEALAPKGEDGIGAYRELLDQWKTAGRAGKKVDDALWARFKAAGDALYSARGEREAAETEASQEKIAAKRELLAEARTVADESNPGKARTLLTGIQRRWDEIGRIFPRDKERALDDELRKIETALRGREDVEWKRNNPETKARANDMTRQLTDAIEKLEQELAAATASGDKKAQARAAEALEARKAWLRAVGG
ncbi:hypothetical protein CVS47_01389 [Microbacterium lemovicicum]|uniref:DUF349 domain-containing protein n=1 Tax=Microbacterium lemovicicum TaxID=1072463 RepID=A0A3Q9IZ32_9MICO|nr:hypothetical protein CVS47_01389 [Microbacterium lemovicicum]